MHELILGGAKSGKSRTAESRAAAWLAGASTRSAVLIATALPADDEMRTRIARHRRERAARLPALDTVEVPLALNGALRERADPQRLLIVDCQTHWLTQRLLPPAGPELTAAAWTDEEAALVAALAAAPGPVVLVSNEIGLGVMPVSAEARRCVDALGALHQQLAAGVARVTLMVAGLELKLKG